MINKGLVPHGVQGGTNRLCFQLVRLRDQQNIMHSSHSVTISTTCTAVVTISRIYLKDYYLTGSWKQVQFHIRIGQAIGVHGLETLHQRWKKCMFSSSI